MKNLQKICFRLSSVFAVLAVVFCLVVPASAYGLDPIKYTESYSPNGSYDHIDVSLPMINAWYYLFSDGNQQTATSFVDLLGGYPMTTQYTFFSASRETQSYSARFPLLGVSGDGSQYLDVSQVPDGSTFHFRFSNSFIIPDNASFFVQCFFYDSSMEQIGSARTGQLTFHEDLGYWSASTNSGKTAGAVGARFTIYCNFNILPRSDNYIGDSFGFSFDRDSTFQVSFNIPSYIWDDSQEKTNATLGQIDKGQQDLIDQNDTMIDQNQQIIDKNDTIIDQNQDLIDRNDTIIDQNQDIIDKNDEIIDQNDQIINGDVVPESPDGSDRLDDLDDTEAGLRDDAQDGLDTGIEIAQNALQIVLQYTTAFACAGWIFERFSTLPLFTALLFVSMALGVFGFVANILQEVGAASREAKRRDQKYQNRKIIKQSRRR